MRVGTLWRVAVLASLALLVSGQLCMLTTCVPRLTPLHAAAMSFSSVSVIGDALRLRSKLI